MSRSDKEDKGHRLVDPWGFYVNSMPWWELRESQRSYYYQLKKDRRRDNKWTKMHDHANGLKLYADKNPDKLKLRIRKGIPRSWRRAIWPELLDIDIGRHGQKKDTRFLAFNKRKKSDAEQKKLRGPSSFRSESARQGRTYRKLASDTAGEVSRDSIFEVVERDLGRTYPQHRLFESIMVDGGRVDKRSESRGISSLRRMLRAYAALDPEIEYCQGMNYVAALLLIHAAAEYLDFDAAQRSVNDPTRAIKRVVDDEEPTPEKNVYRNKKKNSTSNNRQENLLKLDGSAEEDAFWLFVAALRSPRTNLRELYEPGMLGARRVLFVYNKILESTAPNLHDHLSVQLGIIPDMYATHWLITVFAAQFPYALVTRVWDTFLVRGWKPVYRVAVALLLAYEDQILQFDFEQTLTWLRTLPDIVDVDKVLFLAYNKINFSSELLDQFNHAFDLSIQDEAATNS